MYVCFRVVAWYHLKIKSLINLFWIFFFTSLEFFLYKTIDFEVFNQFKGNVYSNLHYLERSLYALPW